jgi:cellobiose phosphorylase
VRYNVEPYVIAADVYDAPGHVGRGGWTWYTGSASWSYRAAIEAMLGFRKRGDTLTIAPCIPGSWSGYQIHYRHGSATYDIAVENPHGASTIVTSVLVDGAIVSDGTIPLQDDGSVHTVRVVMGTP